MKREKIPSVQSWLPYEQILNKGIIKLKDETYIKILQVTPINYTLKSDLEKEAILNSYINLFKSTSLNLQILIQSRKEDLSKNIKLLQKTNSYEELKEKYIQYIQYLNKNKKSSSKNFYLIIQENTSIREEKVKIEKLQNEYIKVKDLLSRCGNIVSEYTEEKEIVSIFYSFLNSNKF